MSSEAPTTPAAQLCLRGNSGSYTIQVGQTILEAAMSQGIDLDHACGGVCACSTCHVKIHTGQDAFSEPTDDELDQLDEARDVSLESRLGCQARLEQRPQGAVVDIEIPAWNVNLVKEGH